MLREIDTYFLQKHEPIKSCITALREIILKHDKNITEVWRYCLVLISTDKIKDKPPAPGLTAHANDGANVCYNLLPAI